LVGDSDSFIIWDHHTNGGKIKDCNTYKRLTHTAKGFVASVEQTEDVFATIEAHIYLVPTTQNKFLFVRARPSDNIHHFGLLEDVVHNQLLQLYRDAQPFVQGMAGWWEKKPGDRSGQRDDAKFTIYPQLKGISHAYMYGPTQELTDLINKHSMKHIHSFNVMYKIPKGQYYNSVTPWTYRIYGVDTIMYSHNGIYRDRKKALEGLQQIIKYENFIDIETADSKMPLMKIY
jgi:hypothetical protein